MLLEKISYMHFRGVFPEAMSSMITNSDTKCNHQDPRQASGANPWGQYGFSIALISP